MSNAGYASISSASGKVDLYVHSNVVDLAKSVGRTIDDMCELAPSAGVMKLSHDFNALVSKSSVDPSELYDIGIKTVDKFMKASIESPDSGLDKDNLRDILALMDRNLSLSGGSLEDMPANVGNSKSVRLMEALMQEKPEMDRSQLSVASNRQKISNSLAKVDPFMADFLDKKMNKDFTPKSNVQDNSAPSLG